MADETAETKGAFAGAEPRPLRAARRWTGRLARTLDAALIEVPDAADPGLPACGLALVRLIGFTLLAILAPAGLLLVLTPAAPAMLDRWGPMAVLAAFCGVLELSRYGFVRRARSPRDALTLFTTLTLCTFLAALAASGAPILMIGVVAATEVLASLILWVALPYRQDRFHLIAALIIVHGALLIAALQISGADGQR